MFFSFLFHFISNFSPYFIPLRKCQKGRVIAYVNRFSIRHPWFVSPYDILRERSRRHELFQRLLGPANSQGRSGCLARRTEQNKSEVERIFHCARQKGSGTKRNASIREDTDCLRSCCFSNNSRDSGVGKTPSSYHRRFKPCPFSFEYKRFNNTVLNFFRYRIIHILSRESCVLRCRLSRGILGICKEE